MQTRRILAMLVALSLPFAPVSAFAGGAATGGATLPEQIVQEATAIQSKISGAERLVEQIQQYENMVQNMVTLPQTMMNQVLQPVDQLYGLVSQAQQLETNAMNIGNQFQNLNASFNPQITAEYSQHYESISQGLNNALNTLLQQANLNPSQFTDQAQAEQAIANAMQNPTSRNALLQGSVAVGQATVSSLTQMNALLNQQANVEAEWKKAQMVQTNKQKGYNQDAVQALYGNPDSNQPVLTSQGGTLNATGNFFKQGESQLFGGN